MPGQPSFFSRCAHELYVGAISLLILFVVFSILEWAFYFRRIKKPWQATLLDLKYAFLGFLYPPFLDLVFAGVFGYIALQGRDNAHNPQVSAGAFVGELLALLLVRDIVVYVRHRIFHEPMAWAFHSIHHSSEEVNWLSAVRFHPVENLIETLAETLLFSFAYWWICVPAGVLSAAGIIIAVYNAFEHSNVRWTFGPLRYVLVSPVFHRWHHSDNPEAMNRNFAAMFSFIDLICGTFYMPIALRPDTTGLSIKEKQSHPKTFTGQILHPFKRTGT